MFTKFKAHLARAALDIQEDRWFRTMNGGFAYEVYMTEQALDWERGDGIPTIAPNRTGLWLIVLLAQAGFYFRLAWYVVTGQPTRAMCYDDLDDDPLGDWHGRNV